MFRFVAGAILREGDCFVVVSAGCRSDRCVDCSRHRGDKQFADHPCQSGPFAEE